MKLSDLVADPMFAPKAWQSGAPDELFKSRTMPVGESADLERILALPRRAPVDLTSLTAQAMVEIEMNKYGRDNPNCLCRKIDPRRDCITRLLPVQAWALREISMVGGCVGALPVGIGKTILDLLCILALGVPNALLLIPASLVDQIQVDYEMLSQHFRVPSIVIHGSQRFERVIPNEPTLVVLPYSRLSLPTSSDWIENLSPAAIIADEADALKDRTSSRTIRLLRHFAGHAEMTKEQRAIRQATKFCCWTGSLTDKSVSEFAHLSALALRYGSPVPIDPDVVEEWGRCLDAIENPSPPGALIKLCDPGENVRDAFARRLADTPGFLVTGTNTVIQADGQNEVGILVRERVLPNGVPQRVLDALDKVRSGVRPDTLVGSVDDEELEDALAQARCASEIASGLILRWIFPKGEPEDLKKHWYAMRKLWHKEKRSKMIVGEQYLDSNKLCEAAAQRAWGDIPPDPKRPSWKAVHWPAWRDVAKLVYHESEAIRYDDFLAQDAANWATEHRGIVWYQNSELGRWIGDLSGLEVHEGGPKAGKRLRGVTGERSIIASLRSHGRGRDGLQHIYHQQLVAQMPASSASTEQLLGRLHRRGQREEAVQTDIYLHVEESQRVYEQAVRRSEYVQGVLRQRQKLLFSPVQ